MGRSWLTMPAGTWQDGVAFTVRTGTLSVRSRWLRLRWGWSRSFRSAWVSAKSAIAWSNLFVLPRYPANGERGRRESDRAGSAPARAPATPTATPTGRRVSGRHRNELGTGLQRRLRSGGLAGRGVLRPGQSSSVKVECLARGAVRSDMFALSSGDHCCESPSVLQSHPPRRLPVHVPLVRLVSGHSPRSTAGVRGPRCAGSVRAGRSGQPAPCAGRCSRRRCVARRRRTPLERVCWQCHEW